jgi:hypothetical protein
VSRGSIPLYRSGARPGYSLEISTNPRRVIARKRPCELEVEFTPVACLVQTAEGAVHAQPGDAIVTGIAGERWSMSPARFGASYRPVPPTVAGQSGRYVSLPIEVMSVPMSGPFEVLLSDGRSRLRGGRGDWLVDYGDGGLGIVSQAIFPATYEIIG